MFFGPIGKTRWPPWPLIGWDIFDLSSENSDRNSTKLDRRQDLNILYYVRLFGLIGKTRWPPWPLINWDIFDFSSETAERNSTKLNRKEDLNVLYQVCVFLADRKNKMAALASDWLIYFRLLLLNCWTEFNETWQEARSQHPLPSLCFSGWSEKLDGRPGLWLAETSTQAASFSGLFLVRRWDPHTCSSLILKFTSTWNSWIWGFVQCWCAREMSLAKATQNRSITVYM